MSTTQTGNGAGQRMYGVDVVLTVLFAFIIPGGGHLYMKKLQRGIIYFLSLTALVVAGIMMKGTLFSLWLSNSGNGFLQLLAAIGNLGLGLAHFVVLMTGLGAGEITARTNEYGTTFLIVAALCNILIALNAYDIAVGEKK